MSFAGEDDFTFHVFDRIFEEQLPFWKRMRDTFWLQFTTRPAWVVPLATELLHTIEEIYTYEQKLLDLGYEGVILRNPDSFYKFGRSSPGLCELVKLKRFEDTEAAIIGYEELRSNQNEATINALGYTERSGHQSNLVPMETLGGLWCRGLWPSGEEYRVRVGSGFTAEQRASLWNQRDELIGRVIKFKYFAGGVKDAPRFPIFLGFRDGDDL
jgi:DNA ligase-1